jgi:hypothetical protein
MLGLHTPQTAVWQIVDEMPIIGFALGRKTDARWLIAAGLLLMAISNYWMSQMNLFISPGQVSGRVSSWS